MFFHHMLRIERESQLNKKILLVDYKSSEFIQNSDYLLG